MKGANVDNINNFCPIDNPALSDLVALWSSRYQRNGYSTIQSVLALYSQGTDEVSLNKVQYEQPSATGFSITVNPLTDLNEKANTWLLMRPLANYAAGTILLPPITQLADQMEVLITTTGSVTTLTFSGNGVTVNGAPSTLSVNDRLKFKYDLTTNAWYRIL